MSRAVTLLLACLLLPGSSGLVQAMGADGPERFGPESAGPGAYGLEAVGPGASGPQPRGPGQPGGASAAATGSAAGEPLALAAPASAVQWDADMGVPTGAWTGLDAVVASMPDVTFTSPLLGTLATSAAPAAYVARAALPGALDDALASWQAATGLAGPPHAGGPEQAWHAPVAALLMAMADATRLQDEALDDLSPAQVSLLVHLLSHPTDPGDEDPALHGLLAKVDLRLLLASARLVAGTAAATAPALDAWAATQRDAERGFPAQRLAAAVDAGTGPAQRLLAAIDMLGAASQATEPAALPATGTGEGAPGTTDDRRAAPGAGADTTRLRAAGTPGSTAADATGAPRRDALMARMGAEAADGAWAHGAQAGGALAAARLDALAFLIDARTDPQGVLEGLAQHGPVLEAWGGATAHDPAWRLGSSAAAVTGLAGLAAAIKEPSQAVAVSSILMGVDLPAPGPGAGLAESVFALYASLGIPLDDATRQQIEAGASALDPRVEAAAGGVLGAQLRARARLAQVAEATGPEQLLLMAGLDAYLAGQGPLPAWDDLREAARLRQQWLQAQHAGAADVAFALEEAEHILSHVEPPRPAPARAWGARLVDWVLPVPGAQAQSVPGESTVPVGALPCPSLTAIADCANDIHFRDPAGLVVVTGPGQSTLELPAASGATATARGHVLVLDLGGDDVYRTNAGGARLAMGSVRGGGTSPDIEPRIDALAVAVHFDYAGNDRYEPPAGMPNVIQGAAVGGIGILWDRVGTDQYKAGSFAQGHGGSAQAFHADGSDDLAEGLCGGDNLMPCTTAPMGFGLLLDGGGNDVYVAQDSAQGHGGSSAVLASRHTFQPPAGARSLPLAGGVGILVDLVGHDRYTLEGTQGQGHGASGLGILIDAAGNDAYAGGRAGSGSGLGLGIFVDGGGEDDHERLSPAGERAADRQCFAEHSLPPETPLEPEVSNVPGTVARHGKTGVFVDAQPTCSLQGGVPSPDGLVQDAQRDTDGDGWNDAIEKALGTGADEPGRYPAGLPREPPDGWPQGLPYPPSGVRPPHGSPYLVDVLGLLRVGDGGGGTWLHDPALVTVDLGGSDTFAGPVAAPGLHVSLGEGDDLYNAAAPCSIACDGILIDLGGNDIYEGNGPAFGSVSTGTQALLLDLDGHDTYRTSGHAASVDQAQAPANPLGGVSAGLIDLAGDDTYDAAGLGAVVRVQPGPLAAAGQTVAAFFIDAAGHDAYIGTTLLGAAAPDTATGEPPETPVAPGTAWGALFFDAQGNDTYAGTRDGGPDVSQARNDRLRITPHHGASRGVGVFWDMAHEAAAEDRAVLRLADASVLVAGAGDDVHAHHWALLVDPGGNDTYRNNAGATLLAGKWAAAPAVAVTGCDCPSVDLRRGMLPVAAVAVDLAGDDLYDVGNERAPHVGQGLSPVVGDGLLSQGAGMLGTGLLLDVAGDDTYRARGMAQGFGTVGTGILWDRAGDDVRTGTTDVVRGLVRGAAATAWLAWQGDQWLVRLRHDADPPCTWTLPLPAAPPLPPPVPLQLALGASALYVSALDLEDLTPVLLRTALPTDGCGPDGEGTSGTWTPVDPARARQLDPHVRGQVVYWADDRADDLDIYRIDLGKTVPQVEPVVQGPGDQRHPGADGRFLVWQDDADGQIHLRDSLQAGDRILSAGLAGNHTRPVISQALVAWQVEDGGELDIAVANLNTAQRLRLIVPGPQTAPTVSAGAVMFASGDGIHRYTWGGDPAGARIATGSAPAMDPGTQHGYAFLGQQGGYPAPMRASLAQAQAPVVLDAPAEDGPSRRMQGTAWVAGIGALVDEAGVDRYEADAWAQGAGYTLGTPPTDLTPQGDASEVSSHGLLLEMDGDDLYVLGSDGQGAHVGQGGSTGGPGGLGDIDLVEAPVERGHDSAVLLDVRGNDTYRGGARTQGSSAWTAGATVVQQTAPGPAAPAPGAIATWKAGMLIDLGGADDYVSSGSYHLLARLVSGDAATAAGALPVEALLCLQAAAADPLAAASACGFEACADQAQGCPLPACAHDPMACIGTWRNDAIWRRPTRSPDGGNNELTSLYPEPPSPDDPGGWQPGAAPTCTRPCPGFVHVGGLLADMPLMDPAEGALRAVARDMLDIDVDFLANSVSTADGRTVVEGDIMLLASVDSESALRGLIEVRATEFFVVGAEGSAFLGKGVPAAGCDPGVLACHAAGWSTRPWPDGEYTVVVQARMGLVGGLGPALGSARAEVPVAVDNPTRLLAFAAMPDRFSPHPATPDALPQPTITFSITSDLNRTQAGFATLRVHDATGPLRTLLPADPGDAAAGPGYAPVEQSHQVSWNGRDDAGQLVPSGAYQIVLNVTDHPDGAQRATVASVTVTVDRDAPGFGCIVPLGGGWPSLSDLLGSGLENACNKALMINRGGSTPAGDPPRTQLTLAFTSLAGEAPARSHLLHEVDGEWTLHSSTTGTAQVQLLHNTSTRWMVLLEDDVGNIECIPGCGMPADESVVRGPVTAESLAQAVAAKLSLAAPGAPAAAPPALDIFTDLVAPSIQGVSWTVDGAAVALSKQPRVATGSEVAIAFTVVDEGGSSQGTVGQAEVVWKSLVDTSLSTSLTIPIVGQGEPIDVAWSHWDDLRDAQGQPWPEGPITWTVQVRDVAGNAPAAIGGRVLLDRSAPAVDGQSIDAGYAAGKFAEAGQRIDPTFVAHDPSIHGAQTLDRDLTGTLDARAIAPTAGVLPLGYRPGAGVFGVKTGGVNGLDVEVDPDQPTFYDLPFEIRDTVGNTATGVVRVLVGSPGLLPTLVSATATTTSIHTSWSTQLPADLTIEVARGNGAFQSLQGGTTAATDHAITINDLDPGTAYRLRAVAIDALGVPQLSDILQVTTLRGLSVAFDAPTAGHASGLLDVTVTADALATAGASPDLTLTLEPLEGHGKPVELLRKRGFGTTSTLVVTGAVADGAWRLHATLESGSGPTLEKASAVLGPIRIDNTPPAVTLLEPGSGSVAAAAPTRLVAEIKETGSGLKSVVAVLDGQPINSQVELTTVAPGVTRAVATGLPALPDGEVRIGILAGDLAGNWARDHVPVRIDHAAPVSQVDMRFGDKPAGRPGGPLTLTLAGSDAANAWADLSAIGGLERVHFVQVDGRWELQALIPAGTADGTYVVPVAVVDQAGRESGMSIAVRVDGRPPVLAWQMEPAPLGVLYAHVLADESASVDVRVDGLPTQRVRLEADEIATAVFRGLVDGQAYDLQIEATDGAGNTAKATDSFRQAPFVAELPLLAAPDVTVRPEGAVVSWATPTQGLRFRILDLAQGGEQLAIAPAPPVKLSLVAGRTYELSVQPVNLLGVQGEASPATTVVGAWPRQLSDVSVLPSTGLGGTPFQFTLRLEGMASPAPDVWFVVSDVAHLARVEGDCRRACEATASIPLATRDLRHPDADWHVEVMDAGGLVRLPPAGVLQGPVVLAGPPGEPLEAQRLADAPPHLAGWAGAGAATTLVAIGVWAWRRRP